MILRFIYNRYAAKFEEFLVDDYVKNIPLEVTEQAFSVIASNKKKFKVFTDYLAYNLHRRMASDPTKSEKYLGMFVQLRVMDSLIAGRTEKQEKKKDPLKTQEASKYKEHFEAAEGFAKSLITKRNE